VTMARVIDGKAIAEDLRRRVQSAVEQLEAAHGFTPGLAVVLVGDNPASRVYVANKARQTAEVGMKSFEHRLPATTSEAELLGLVNRLNNDPEVDGILIQLPLPKQIGSDKVINAVNPDKDVDGFHVISAGRLATGQDALVPCTPVGCVILAKTVLGKLEGLEAVVVGRSNIVGKPVAQLLLQENATVTIAHSRTRDLPAVCRRADLVIAAVGKPRLIRGDWLKPGATVIDVGINRIEENGKARIVGDCDYEDCARVAGHITPVPGGVGPMTIACLLANTVKAACLARGLAVPEGVGSRQ
jgi:methylenetetrahydrofolate dehydrogenase (NADP+) / methenyltetrahydrofolate cyclohydrolase